MSAKVYNLVAIGNTGVGKSALFNFLSNSIGAFPEGDTACSVTSKAYYKEFKWMGDEKSHTVRFCDTQGLSDSRGIDSENIKQMIATIKMLKHVDVFLICFNGDEPRFSDYIKGTIQMFIEMFGKDFLNHVVLVFNKWYGQIKRLEDETRTRSEFQKHIETNFGKKDIPCYFLDSQCKLRMKRPNPLTGDEEECVLPAKIQDKTLSQTQGLYMWLITKNTSCNVQSATAKQTKVDELKTKVAEDTRRTQVLKNNVKLLENRAKRAQSQESEWKRRSEQEQRRINNYIHSINPRYQYQYPQYSLLIPESDYWPTRCRICGQYLCYH